MDLLTALFLALAVLGALGAVPVVLLATRWAWRHVVLPLNRWWTSRRARRVQRIATDLSLKDGVLREGCLVLAKFQAAPSDTWRDPGAEVQGIWDGKRAVPPQSPLRFQDWDGTVKHAEPSWVPLCIPSLRVEPEWREATHVRIDPLWSSLKPYVVSRFLNSVAGQDFVCSVVIGRKKGGVLLNCPAYDEYLQNEWPHFKGLEAALTVNALYRQRDLIDMSPRRLKDFVFHNLPTLLNKATVERVPKQYRRTLETRSPDPEAIYLVLKGLAERYNQSGIPPLANSAPPRAQG